MSFLLYWMWTIHQVSFNAFWGKSFQVIWLCWNRQFYTLKTVALLIMITMSMNMRKTVKVERNRLLCSCNVQYVAVGCPGMWSLCGCLLRDFSAQKIGFLCNENWISLQRKLDFSAKKNEFPVCWLWISSGDTAGRQSSKLISNKKPDGITLEIWLGILLYISSM